MSEMTSEDKIVTLPVRRSSDKILLNFFFRDSMSSLWSKVKKLSVLFWSLTSYILVAYIHPELITSLEGIAKNIGEL